MQKHYNQAISNYQCVPHISQPTSFTHPKLTDEEMRNGCRLGIDSFADTCVAGKHAHVIDFIDGKEISARAWDGHKTQNLRIANVAYAYDTPMGKPLYLYSISRSTEENLWKTALSILSNAYRMMYELIADLESSIQTTKIHRQYNSRGNASILFTMGHSLSYTLDVQLQTNGGTAHTLT